MYNIPAYYLLHDLLRRQYQTNFHFVDRVCSGIWYREQPRRFLGFDGFEWFDAHFGFKFIKVWGVWGLGVGLLVDPKSLCAGHNYAPEIVSEQAQNISI